jgi:serine-type D-Ala-D-Ala carboxypeptidase (penicillin-binding protein 5/6)
MPARTSLVLAAAVLATDLLAAGLSPAAAAPTTSPSAHHRIGVSPVGGPLLGSRGLIVTPHSDAPALPAASQLPASSWLVADLSTGQVLAAKAPHERFLPASTLKMLTALTLLPRLNPTRRITATNHDARVDGSRVGLVPGHHYAVAKLFSAMLMVSANDAADALSQAAGGTRSTLAAMNAEAHHLQADDTVAKTPSGLDATGESSSAYDLALIARAGLARPDFRRYVGTVKSRMPARHGKHFQIYTHNELLTTYPGDIGVKNGYTVAAQGTDVQAATRHGHTILVTLMHANPDFWPMARLLLNWGFHALGKVDPVGTLVGPLRPASATTATLHHASPAPDAATLDSNHSRTANSLGLTLLGVSAVFVLFTAGMQTRRRRRRRYRSRWSMPRGYH